MYAMPYGPCGTCRAHHYTPCPPCAHSTHLHPHGCAPAALRALQQQRRLSAAVLLLPHVLDAIAWQALCIHALLQHLLHSSLLQRTNKGTTNCVGRRQAVSAPPAGMSHAHIANCKRQPQPHCKAPHQDCQRTSLMPGAPARARSAAAAAEPCAGRGRSAGSALWKP